MDRFPRRRFERSRFSEKTSDHGRSNYGVPRAGNWQELLCSDSKIYGGSGYGNFGGVDTVPLPSHGHNYSLSLVLPPLGIVFLKSEAPAAGTIQPQEDADLGE